MDWAQVLVIILAIALAIFLILGIILTILLIKVTKDIRNMTESANRTVNSVEHMVTNVNKIASPALMGKMVFEQFNKARKRTKKGE